MKPIKVQFKALQFVHRFRTEAPTIGRWLNKIGPYYLTVAGCIAHAVVLHVFGNQLANPMQPHREPSVWVWLSLLLIWPAWSVALWYCSRKKWAMTVPMIVGMVVMWP